MNYRRKVHLYGDPCPSAYGATPATVLPLQQFLRLPEKWRCTACDKRAKQAPSDYPTGTLT
jgi:hypothetical protein